jgi:fucose 4-O-acetylase-like acetyltransferase
MSYKKYILYSINFILGFIIILPSFLNFYLFPLTLLFTFFVFYMFSVKNTFQIINEEPSKIAISFILFPSILILINMFAVTLSNKKGSFNELPIFILIVAAISITYLLIIKTLSFFKKISIKTPKEL